MIKLIYFLLLANIAYAREVEFSWAPMPGALKYEIQISKTQKFDKPLSTAITEKPNFPSKLDVGRYFYRVRVLDLKGRPGKWSNPATVLIDPYSPELVSPATGFETSYFELLPDIEFTWKSPQENLEYEILISKTSGEKVLEDKAKGFSFKTNKIPEGEYSWKVRTITDTISSGYSEPRRFNVTKKPLTAPKLIKPEKDGVAAAYRPVHFEWEKDIATKYTDLHYEKISSTTSDGKVFKTKQLNLASDDFTDPYEEPGVYKWWIVTKEDKNSPGITSDIQNFELRNDVLSRGNYELEFSLSPVNDLYTTSSARQTFGVSQISQQSSSNGMFVGFLGGYYFFESLGIFLSERTAKVSVENFSDMITETDFQFRLRFGSRGFNQEFILGYRLMDIIEAENNPVVETTAMTAGGPLVGTRLTASITPTIKTQLTLQYFKPFMNVQGTDGLVSDVYEGSLGVKWNFMYQFWLGYRFQMERINSSFSTLQQAPAVNASWTQYRLEPFYISVSFEH
jgi:hypothetical protein